MPDLEGRFRQLRRATPPDLWPRITTAEPAETGPEPPQRGRRVLTVALSFAVAAAGIALAVRAFQGDGGRPAQPPPPQKSVTPTNEDLIAFARADGEYRIAVVSPAQGRVINLTEPPTEGFDLSPLWSPDGSRIAFARYIVQDEVNGLGEYAIFVADADGSSPRQITTPGVGTFAWSPDGLAIAYTRTAGPDSDSVWVAELEGGGHHVVRGHLPGRAAWGAHDELLVERWGNEAGGPGLYAVRPDGTGMRRIRETETWGAAWSPDGTRIAFVTIRDGNPDGNAEVRTIGADGTNAVLVHEAPTGDAHDPTWSPDGTHIAFSLHDGESWEVGVAQADGSGGTIIAGSPDDEAGPAWSPDGDRIALSRAPACGGCDNAGSADIVLAAPDGTDVVTLTTGAQEIGSSLVWRPSGPPGSIPGARGTESPAD